MPTNLEDIGSEMEIGAIAAIATKGLAALSKQIGIGTSFTDEFAKSVGVANNAMLKMNGISDGMIAGFEQIANAAGGNISSALSALTNKMFDQINAYQNLNVQITKLGRGEDTKQFIEQTRIQAYETIKLGLSVNNLIDANKELLGSYNSSLIINKKQAESFNNSRDAMAQLVAFNEKFGVSTNTSTSILNLFNGAMNGGVTAAQNFSDELLIFSQKTGQDANKVFQQFNEQISRFAILESQQAVDSFAKIEMAAKRTGESIGGIITSISKFDDIEEGFKTGGQINRVLSFMGGSFDTFKAMQADDQTRAQMMLEAISGVSLRYQEMTSTQQKRSMVKQLAESFHLDEKTVLGLLNKSGDLKTDISDIFNGNLKGITDQKFTEAGREAAGMKVTTPKELSEAVDQFARMGPITAKLSDIMSEHTKVTSIFSAKFFKQFDVDFAGPISGMKNMEDAKEIFTHLAKRMTEYPKELQTYVENSNKQNARFDSVTAGNTEAVNKHIEVTNRLSNILDKGINVNVNGTIDSKTGKAPVTGKTQLTTDSVMSYMPVMPAGFGVK